MTVFKTTAVFCSLILILQGCVSAQSGHYDTKAPSVLDGGWIETKCMCADTDMRGTDLQYATVMIINGNKLFQQQIGRWRKAEWVRYCSIHQEASMRPISDDVFEVTTTAERTFSAGDAKCSTNMNKSNRTWKILKVDKSELKYESTSGCVSGPMTCSFKRIDQ